ncbi:MAG: hypothetical protein AAF541_15860 [Pseudomonadota bacterium]
MKAVFTILLAVSSSTFLMGCAHAHKSGVHSHTPPVPDAVKARCAVKADRPRVCIDRWKENHTYTHRHSGRHHWGHTHVKAPKVKVAVVVPVK